MTPISKTISLDGRSRRNPLIASADTPPGWQNSYFNNVPFLGVLLSMLGNAPKYNIKLEDCADFIANELEKSNTEFVGHRVGLRDTGKGKTE